MQETVYLLFSDANLAGYGLTPEMVMSSISARNAVIPGGTMRTEGRNFPVQLSGEYKTERDMLGTVVGMGRGGAPVYLRDVFDVRRMYESPIPYKVDVVGRTGKDGSLDTRRAVMVAVEMRDGEIIRYFNRGRHEGGGGHESPHARKAWSSGCCPTNPRQSSIASITSSDALSRRW